MQRKKPRVQTDRIMFNGHDLSALVFCKVNRPIMADVSALFENVAGRHGELFKAAYRGGYDLPVDMWLRSEHRRDVAEVRHKLAAMLWSEEPAPLYLPDDPERYLLAIVSGSTDLGEITDDCPMATVTFRIGDPDYYGRKRRVEVTAGTFAVNAGGNLPARLSITAKPGAAPSWTISNIDTGEKVQVSQALTSGSTVRIDMAQERATVNNQAAPVTLDSDFFEITGRTRLRISSGSAVLEWRERWL